MIEYVREGERVHFLREDYLEQALRHGYLELQVVGDQGVMNRVVRYLPDKGSYFWYEAPEGYRAQARNCKAYLKIEHLTEEHDLHAYKWYPLYPLGSVRPPFEYHGLLDDSSFRESGKLESIRLS